MEKRTYLTITPDSRPDALRAAGKLAGGDNALEYDRSQKLWFAKDGADLEKITSWLPENAVAGNYQTTSDLTPAQEFAEVLRGAGFVLPNGELPEMDGRRHRASVEGDKSRSEKSGVYQGFSDGHPAGWYQNHRASEDKMNWKSTGEYRSDPAQAMQQRALNAQKLWDRQQEQQAIWDKTAASVGRQWQKMPPALADHPYLVRKQVPAADGVRQDRYGNLVIPLSNLQGALRTVEYIDPDGKKNLKKDAEKMGNFFVFGGELQPGKPVLYAEGYATAGSLHLATGMPVVMTVDAGNLVTVSQNLKAAFPDSPHIILGEDDFTKKDNKGLNKAREAAERIGAVYVIPAFTDEERAQAFAGTAAFSDFNDIHVSRGLEAVRDQLAPVLDPVAPDWRLSLIQVAPSMKDTDTLPAAPATPVQENAHTEQPPRPEVPAATPQAGDAPTAGDTAAPSADSEHAVPLPRQQVGPDAESWVNVNAQQARDLADQLKLTEQIEHLFAEGKTVNEVQAALRDALTAIPGEEQSGFIGQVRASLGIPSRATQEGEAEFQAWRQQRDTLPEVAETTLSVEIPVGGAPEQPAPAPGSVTSGTEDESIPSLASLLNPDVVDTPDAPAETSPDHDNQETADATVTSPDDTAETARAGDNLESRDITEAARVIDTPDISDTAETPLPPDPTEEPEQPLPQTDIPDAGNRPQAGKPGEGAGQPDAAPQEDGFRFTYGGNVSDLPPDAPPLDLDKLLQQMTHRMEGQTWIYALNNEDAFVHHIQSDRFVMASPAASLDDQRVLCALLTARDAAISGHRGGIEITGSDAFKEKVLGLIVAHNLDVRLSNPDQRAQLDTLRQATVAPQDGLQMAQAVKATPAKAAPSPVQANPGPSSPVTASDAPATTPPPAASTATVASQASQPEAPVGKPEAGTRKRAPWAEALTGRLLEHGAAPYQFLKENNESYYVKMEMTQGDKTSEKVFWGVELKQAMNGSDVEQNEMIRLQFHGVEPVTVNVPRRNEKGSITHYEEISTDRNKWSVQPAIDRDLLIAREAQAVPPASLSAYDANRFWQLQEQVVKQTGVSLVLAPATGHELLYLSPDGKGQPVPASPPENVPVPAVSNAAGSVVMHSRDSGGELLMHLVKAHGDYLQGVVKHNDQYQHVLGKLCSAQDGATYLALNTLSAQDQLTPLGKGEPVNQVKNGEAHFDSFVFKLKGDNPQFAVPLHKPEKIPAGLHEKLGFTQRYTAPKAEQPEPAPVPRPQAQPTMQPG